MTRNTTDQAIVGAGPVGIVAALAMAKAGEEVALFEGDPSLTKRFAGEWLHPEGLRLLRRHGIHLHAGLPWIAPSRGFAVLPEDGSEPILLDYPGGRLGLAFDRAGLIDLMREHCADTPGINWIPSAKVTKVERGRLEVASSTPGAAGTWTAGRIVGADGRGSIVRRAHGEGRSPHLISYMVGAVVHGIELPFEEYGHVVLGGPGPVLLYRIGDDAVRVCLDVPAALFRSSRDKTAALRGHLERLEPALREPLRRELEAGRFEVRANQFRPRVFYGDAALPLVGDAVGFHHPLTAMGMTLGFADADCLARSDEFRTFERERIASTFVPELLAFALYEAFSRDDRGSASVRRAIYAMWREYEKERDRSMRLLCGEETNVLRFGQSFMRGAQLALAQSLLHGGSIFGIYRETIGTIGTIGKILRLLTWPSSSRLLPLRETWSSSPPKRAANAA